MFNIKYDYADDEEEPIHIKMHHLLADCKEKPICKLRHLLADSEDGLFPCQ